MKEKNSVAQMVESACNAGDEGSIPGLRRSPGEGNDNPLQRSCLENPVDRGAWWAATAMGLQRVGHDLMTKTLYIKSILSFSLSFQQATPSAWSACP